MLFLAFTAYLAVPVLEVPGYGISLSAPMFCVIALELLTGRLGLRWRAYAPWILLAIVFWAAVFLSLAVNTWLGSITEWAAADLLLLLRFAYWLLVFVLTMVAVAHFDLGPRVARVLGFSVLTLGLVRLAEAVVLGHWGSGEAAVLSQNTYGWGFSAFAPSAAWLALESTGGRRWLFTGCLFLLMVAVALNGSRSSWIAVGVGLVLLTTLEAATRRALAARLWVVSLLTAMIFGFGSLLVSSQVFESVRQRASTFAQLSQDKPYVARQLLVEKGLQLFEENPVFGVGIGRFTRSYVVVSTPSALRHGSRAEMQRKSAHNSYVALLAETGLAGTLPFVILVAILATAGGRAALRLAWRGQHWALPVYVGFISMSIHFWTLSGITTTATWFSYGLLAGVIQRELASP